MIDPRANSKTHIRRLADNIQTAITGSIRSELSQYAVIHNTPIDGLVNVYDSYTEHLETVLIDIEGGSSHIVQVRVSEYPEGIDVDLHAIPIRGEINLEISDRDIIDQLAEDPEILIF